MCSSAYALFTNTSRVSKITAARNHQRNISFNNAGLADAQPERCTSSVWHHHGDYTDRRAPCWDRGRGQPCAECRGECECRHGALQRRQRQPGRHTPPPRPPPPRRRHRHIHSPQHDPGAGELRHHLGRRPDLQQRRAGGHDRPDAVGRPAGWHRHGERLRHDDLDGRGHVGCRHHQRQRPCEPQRRHSARLQQPPLQHQRRHQLVGNQRIPRGQRRPDCQRRHLERHQ